MSNPVIQFEKGLLFLAMQNYDVLASVSWRDVIKYLRWALNIEKYDAFRWIGKVQEDIDYLYPDRLEAHLSYALFFCERVFQTVHLLNDLRLFLRYKPFTIEQLKLEKIYSFYEEHNI
nr:unnamed protein product [uncultured bacterium]